MGPKDRQKEQLTRICRRVRMKSHVLMKRIHSNETVDIKRATPRDVSRKWWPHSRKYSTTMMNNPMTRRMKKMTRQRRLIRQTVRLLERFSCELEEFIEQNEQLSSDNQVYVDESLSVMHTVGHALLEAELDRIPRFDR